MVAPLNPSIRPIVTETVTTPHRVQPTEDIPEQTTEVADIPAEEAPQLTEDELSIKSAIREALTDTNTPLRIDPDEMTSILALAQEAGEDPGSLYTVVDEMFREISSMTTLPEDVRDRMSDEILNLRGIEIEGEETPAFRELPSLADIDHSHSFTKAGLSRGQVIRGDDLQAFAEQSITRVGEKMDRLQSGLDQVSARMVEVTSLLEGLPPDSPEAQELNSYLEELGQAHSRIRDAQANMDTLLQDLQAIQDNPGDREAVRTLQRHLASEQFGEQNLGRTGPGGNGDDGHFGPLTDEGLANGVLRNEVANLGIDFGDLVGRELPEMPEVYDGPEPGNDLPAMAEQLRELPEEQLGGFIERMPIASVGLVLENAEANNIPPNVQEALTDAINERQDELPENSPYRELITEPAGEVVQTDTEDVEIDHEDVEVDHEDVEVDHEDVEVEHDDHDHSSEVDHAEHEGHTHDARLTFHSVENHVAPEVAIERAQTFFHNATEEGNVAAANTFQRLVTSWTEMATAEPPNERAVEILDGLQESIPNLADSTLLPGVAEQYYDTQQVDGTIDEPTSELEELSLDELNEIAGGSNIDEAIDAIGELRRRAVEGDLDALEDVSQLADGVDAVAGAANHALISIARENGMTFDELGGVDDSNANQLAEQALDAYNSIGSANQLASLAAFDRHYSGGGDASTEIAHLAQSISSNMDQINHLQTDGEENLFNMSDNIETMNMIGRQVTTDVSGLVQQLENGNTEALQHLIDFVDMSSSIQEPFVLDAIHEAIGVAKSALLQHAIDEGAIVPDATGGLSLYNTQYRVENREHPALVALIGE